MLSLKVVFSYFSHSWFFYTSKKKSKINLTSSNTWDESKCSGLSSQACTKGKLYLYLKTWNGNCQIQLLLLPVLTSIVALNVAMIPKALKRCWAKLWIRMRKSPKYFQQWSRSKLKKEATHWTQLSKFDGISIFYKCMPQRGFISKTRKRAPGFKAAKDRWTAKLMPTPNWDQWVTFVHTCCYNFLLFIVTFLPLLRNHSQPAILASPHLQQTSSLFQGRVPYLLQYLCIS